MPTKTILLIDDDPFVSQLYISRFKERGYELALAEDGDEGIMLAKRLKPDLILLDIIMPKMDGWAVLKTLKEDQELKSIPVALLTNLGQKQEIDRGLAMGARDYLIKVHYTPDVLVAKIETLLGNPPKVTI